MQELEIEKRFYIPEEKIDKIRAYIIPNSGIYMNDFYVPNGKMHKDLRLRQKDDRYMITRKRPVKNDNLTTMLETTIELSKHEFNALSSNIKTNVEKERFIIDMFNRHGELDIFRGRHKGLAILEFEFKNNSDLLDFEKNVQLDLIDVTSIEWIAGGKLAETNFNQLKPKLTQLEKIC